MLITSAGGKALWEADRIAHRAGVCACPDPGRGNKHGSHAAGMAHPTEMCAATDTCFSTFKGLLDNCNYPYIL